MGLAALGRPAAPCRHSCRSCSWNHLHANTARMGVYARRIRPSKITCPKGRFIFRDIHTTVGINKKRRDAPPHHNRKGNTHAKTKRFGRDFILVIIGQIISVRQRGAAFCNCRCICLIQTGSPAAGALFPPATFCPWWCFRPWATSLGK